MTLEPDALDLLAAQALRPDAIPDSDPRPDDPLPASLAPVEGGGVSA